MLTTLAIENYRSVRKLVMPLGRLNVITGANGSGKSNLYRALRLLAQTAQGGVVSALSREGGLSSTLWAGPESISKDMRAGRVPVQGTSRQAPVRLRLGFGSDELSYAIALGLPGPSSSAFARDPEIKSERIWAGRSFRPAATLVDRTGPSVRARRDEGVKLVAAEVNPHESIFGCLADMSTTPEVFAMREQVRSWRFYDHFRTDRDAPARQAQWGTRTPVLHHDGRDVAAALQTIFEIGDAGALRAAVADAFPGSEVDVAIQEDGFMNLRWHQHGLLRPLSGAELSDGTLRFLLWAAAMLTPRPPSLMVLNEPETSLHPDLLPALGRLIVRAAEQSQVWVISHARSLLEELQSSGQVQIIELERSLGQTGIRGQTRLDQPVWRWPDE